MPSANLLRWLILLMVSIQSINAAHAEVRWALSASRAPRLRTMRQFGEDEIVLPEGPFAGRRLNTRRQPFTGLLLDAIDSRQWRRHAITGCVQSGKSLHGYVLPALYHLFELKETTILGLPTMDMAKDKWREEILPVIERSRYRHLLPDSGAGSRGGTVEAIKFKHGPTLKFMSGHGGDEKRSSFTARVVVVTEADKMDTAGEASRETSPLGQIEARTLAYGDQARVYLECTVSIEQGAIWTEYNAGTRSRIACPCPHCGDYVTPDREDLVGWQPAKSAADAKDLASWFCPACGEAIDDDQRVGMNAAGRLVHDGQSIDAAGRIHGEPPRTDTLGFRWNAFNNLFWPTGMIAAGEWAAVRSKDPEDAERERRQFVWTLPHEPDETPELDLDPHELAERVALAPKGQIPTGYERLSLGIDLGSTKAHWVLIAWADFATAHVVDYGKLVIHSKRLGVEKALRVALKYFRDEILLPGWPAADGGGNRRPDMALVDSGAWAHVVYRFIRESQQAPDCVGWIYPVAGRGWQKQYGGSYNAPPRKTRQIRLIGEQYHFVRDPAEGILRGLVNADYWKSVFHQRLGVGLDEETGKRLPGGLTLPQIASGDHTELTRHWAAEREVRLWDAAKGGEITKWETVSRANHFFDAAYMATVAGHMAGVRVDGPLVARLVMPGQVIVQQWSAKREGR